MKINRIWAMPNRETFKIKPIRELLKKYSVGKNWIDPFAGKNSPAEYTNDLNPKMPTDVHGDAVIYCMKWEGSEGKFDGVLFDPPYSLRQIKECYDAVGETLDYDRTKHASFDDVKRVISPKIKSGGYAISFGWSSNGFGKNRGFEIVEILLVPHGGHHNDTICVVERKEKTLL